MTANQRRPGFRLPWSSESDAATGAGEPATAEPATSAAPNDAAGHDAAAPAASTDPTQPPAEPSPGGDASPSGATTVSPPAPRGASGPSAQPGPTDDFMRELVTAMRKVADEARQHGLDELKARAEEQVRQLEAGAERRRQELKERAEADLAGIGEWARAEAERIKAEAEQRVVARRAQLEQQLAGDSARTESEARAVRERVAEYERELEAFYAQLAEINDPAAFAAAAKRMPAPPRLGNPAAKTTSEPARSMPDASAATASARAADAATATAEADGAPAAAPADAATAAHAPVESAAGGSNGVTSAATAVHPAEEEVLAARLAELDAALPEGASAPAASEPVTTEIVVKGLGSFGAITGFRQSLAGVDGIDGVALSLGQTGEFVFRATHRPGFDVRDAITKLEGDGAKIDDRPEGGLKVTLDRAR